MNFFTKKKKMNDDGELGDGDYVLPIYDDGRSERGEEEEDPIIPWLEEREPTHSRCDWRRGNDCANEFFSGTLGCQDHRMAPTPNALMRRKVRLGVLMQTFVLFILFGFFHYLGGKKHLERFGPQDDFIIMDVVIDTWAKYNTLLLVIAITEVVMVIVKQVASPIIKFNVYNPDKPVIEWIKRFELQMICDANNLQELLIELILLMLFLSKLDILLFGVTVRFITRHFTVDYLLAGKQFVVETSRQLDLENTGRQFAMEMNRHLDLFPTEKQQEQFVDTNIR